MLRKRTQRGFFFSKRNRRVKFNMADDEHTPLLNVPNVEMSPESPPRSSPQEIPSIQQPIEPPLRWTRFRVAMVGLRLLVVVLLALSAAFPQWVSVGNQDFGLFHCFHNPCSPLDPRTPDLRYLCGTWAVTTFLNIIVVAMVFVRARQRKSVDGLLGNCWQADLVLMGGILVTFGQTLMSFWSPGPALVLALVCCGSSYLLSVFSNRRWEIFLERLLAPGRPTSSRSRRDSTPRGSRLPGIYMGTRHRQVSPPPPPPPSVPGDPPAPSSVSPTRPFNFPSSVPYPVRETPITTGEVLLEPEAFPVTERITSQEFREMERVGVFGFGGNMPALSKMFRNLGAEGVEDFSPSWRYKELLLRDSCNSYQYAKLLLKLKERLEKKRAGCDSLEYIDRYEELKSRPTPLNSVPKSEDSGSSSDDTEDDSDDTMESDALRNMKNASERSMGSPASEDASSTFVPSLSSLHYCSSGASSDSKADFCRAKGPVLKLPVILRLAFRRAVSTLFNSSVKSLENCVRKLPKLDDFLAEALYEQEIVGTTEDAMAKECRDYEEAFCPKESWLDFDDDVEVASLPETEKLTSSNDEDFFSTETLYSDSHDDGVDDDDDEGKDEFWSPGEELHWGFQTNKDPYGDPLCRREGGESSLSLPSSYYSFDESLKPHPEKLRWPETITGKVNCGHRPFDESKDFTDLETPTARSLPQYGGLDSTWENGDEMDSYPYKIPRPRFNPTLIDGHPSRFSAHQTPSGENGQPSKFPSYQTPSVENGQPSKYASYQTPSYEKGHPSQHATNQGPGYENGYLSQNATYQSLGYENDHPNQHTTNQSPGYENGYPSRLITNQSPGYENGHPSQYATYQSPGFENGYPSQNTDYQNSSYENGRPSRYTDYQNSSYENGRPSQYTDYQNPSYENGHPSRYPGYQSPSFEKGHLSRYTDYETPNYENLSGFRRKCYAPHFAAAAGENDTETSPKSWYRPHYEGSKDWLLESPYYPSPLPGFTDADEFQSFSRDPVYDQDDVSEEHPEVYAEKWHIPGHAANYAEYLDEQYDNYPTLNLDSSGPSPLAKYLQREKRGGRCRGDDFDAMDRMEKGDGHLYRQPQSQADTSDLEDPSKNPQRAPLAEEPYPPLHFSQKQDADSTLRHEHPSSYTEKTHEYSVGDEEDSEVHSLFREDDSDEYHVHYDEDYDDDSDSSSEEEVEDDYYSVCGDEEGDEFAVMREDDGDDDSAVNDEEHGIECPVCDTCEIPRWDSSVGSTPFDETNASGAQDKSQLICPIPDDFPIGVWNEPPDDFPISVWNEPAAFFPPPPPPRPSYPTRRAHFSEDDDDEIGDGIDTAEVPGVHSESSSDPGYASKTSSSSTKSGSPDLNQRPITLVVEESSEDHVDDPDRADAGHDTGSSIRHVTFGERTFLEGKPRYFPRIDGSESEWREGEYCDNENLEEWSEDMDIPVYESEASFNSSSIRDRPPTPFPLDEYRLSQGDTESCGTGLEEQSLPEETDVITLLTPRLSRNSAASSPVSSRRFQDNQDDLPSMSWPPDWDAVNEAMLINKFCKWKNKSTPRTLFPKEYYKPVASTSAKSSVQEISSLETALTAQDSEPEARPYQTNLAATPPAVAPRMSQTADVCKNWQESSSPGADFYDPALADLAEVLKAYRETCSRLVKYPRLCSTLMRKVKVEAPPRPSPGVIARGAHTVSITRRPKMDFEVLNEEPRVDWRPRTMQEANERTPETCLPFDRIPYLPSSRSTASRTRISACAEPENALDQNNPEASPSRGDVRAYHRVNAETPNRYSSSRLGTSEQDHSAGTTPSPFIGSIRDEAKTQSIPMKTLQNQLVEAILASRPVQDRESVEAKEGDSEQGSSGPETPPTESLPSDEDNKVPISDYPIEGPLYDESAWYFKRKRREIPPPPPPSVWDASESLLEERSQQSTDHAMPFSQPGRQNTEQAMDLQKSSRLTNWMTGEFADPIKTSTTPFITTIPTTSAIATAATAAVPFTELPARQPEVAGFRRAERLWQNLENFHRRNAPEASNCACTLDPISPGGFMSSNRGV